MRTDADAGALVVTGAGGFLGREIVRQALASRLSVRGLARRPPQDPSPVEYSLADLLEPKDLPAALRGAPAVVHAAGRAHLFRGESSPGQLLRENAEATANVVRAAEEAGVPRVVLASSVSVYEQGTGRRAVDEFTPLRPDSLYGASKLEAERRALEISARGRVRVTILRLTTLYGPGDPGNVHRLIRAIDRGRFVPVGDGSSRKSLLYVADAARACLAAVNLGGNALPAYNVAAAPCTMGEVVGLIFRNLERRLPRLRVPASVALAFAHGGRALGLEGAAQSVQKFLRDDVFAGERFAAASGFFPRVALDQGIAEEVNWYRTLQSGSPR